MKKGKTKPMTVVVPVRLPDVLFDRLNRLKGKTFQPISVIIREAIAEHLNRKGVC